jgi:hypothetical protein
LRSFLIHAPSPNSVMVVKACKERLKLSSRMAAEQDYPASDAANTIVLTHFPNMSRGFPRWTLGLADGVADSVAERILCETVVVLSDSSIHALKLQDSCFAF